MYAKVFSQIFDSSISSDHEVRHVFMDLLVMADRDGYVDMTRDAICRRANIPMPLLVRALGILSAPDPASRSGEKEGRRIELIDEHRDWGWRIVNYAQYRDIRDEEGRRRYFREYQRERRQHLSTSVKDMSLTPFNKSDASHLLNAVKNVTPDTDTDTDTEAKTDTDTEKHKARTASADGLVGNSETAQDEKKARSRTNTAPTPEKPASVAAVSSSDPLPIPPSLQTGAFIADWNRWMVFRRGKKRCKDWAGMFRGQLDWLAQFTPEQASESIKQSIRNDWQGLFEPKTTNGYQPSHRSTSHAPAPGERFIAQSADGDDRWEAAAAEHRRRNLDGPPDDRALPGILGADPETQPGAPS